MILDFKKIQLAMAAKKMPQKELAFLMGISYTTLKSKLYRIREGKGCNPVTAGQFSECLGIPLNELVK
jgi:hypothetical protein